jgi:hypothetical protein
MAGGPDRLPGCNTPTSGIPVRFCARLQRRVRGGFSPRFPLPSHPVWDNKPCGTSETSELLLVICIYPGFCQELLRLARASAFRSDLSCHAHATGHRQGLASRSGASAHICAQDRPGVRLTFSSAIETCDNTRLMHEQRSLPRPAGVTGITVHCACVGCFVVTSS